MAACAKVAFFNFYSTDKQKNGKNLKITKAGKRVDTIPGFQNIH
jgi:hypothetical protein